MAIEDHAENTQEPATTQQLARILSQAPTLSERLITGVRAGVTFGSAASVDQAHPLGHHTGILATGFLSSGIEHLVIWERLLLAGVQPYTAHVTLIRGAMEGAVTCRWLIDPYIDSAARIRRGVALLLEDYANRRDFEQDLGIAVDAIKPPAKPAAERHADLRRERDETKVGRIDVHAHVAKQDGHRHGAGDGDGDGRHIGGLGLEPRRYAGRVRPGGGPAARRRDRRRERQRVREPVTTRSARPARPASGSPSEPMASRWATMRCTWA